MDLGRAHKTRVLDRQHEGACREAGTGTLGHLQGRDSPSRRCTHKADREGRNGCDKDSSLYVMQRPWKAHATASRPGRCGSSSTAPDADSHDGSLTPRFSNFSRKPGRRPVLTSCPTTARSDATASTWKR